MLLVLVNTDELNIFVEPARMKPWFVRKLPSRIEIIEGQSFSFVCYLGRKGCKPQFVRKLPAKMETQRGVNFEAECLIGKMSDTDSPFGPTVVMPRRTSSHTAKGMYRFLLYTIVIYMYCHIFRFFDSIKSLIYF